MKFGYARVSTPQQHLDRQITALEAAGCNEIITEKRSAADIERRPALKKLLAQLRKGDTLVVAEWDRATRSFLDGVAIMQKVMSTGATLKVLDIALDLSDPIQQALVGVLSAIAQKERERNLKRASEGRTEAKKRGQHLGRPTKLSEHQRARALDRLAAGETCREIARDMGVSHSTISRLHR